MPELVTDVPHLPHKQYVIEDTLKVMFFYINVMKYTYSEVSDCVISNTQSK